MNLLIFVVMVIGSFLMVRIAAVAFELTGLEWTLAKFQALSCFTTTGFTTKESELIARYPERRRIASILMILGHAGLIALIAALVNVLGRNTGEPAFLPAVRVVVMSVTIYVCYLLFIKTRFADKIDNLLRKHIVKRVGIELMTCKQLIVATAGYEISSVTISGSNPVANKTLEEAALKARNIVVLAIERGQDQIVNPLPNEKVLPGDILICFGQLGNVKEVVCGK